MDEFVTHITRKTKAEAIYTRERQRTNRERFRAYYAEFHAACGCRDYHRIFQVVQDAMMITDETLQLVQRMSEINTRQRALSSGTGFTGASVLPSTDVKLHVIHAAGVPTPASHSD